MVAAFAQLFTCSGEFDEIHGRALRSLFERRSKADYDVADEPTLTEALSAIDDAG